MARCPTCMSIHPNFCCINQENARCTIVALKTIRNRLVDVYFTAEEMMGYAPSNTAILVLAERTDDVIEMLNRVIDEKELFYVNTYGISGDTDVESDVESDDDAVA